MHGERETSIVPRVTWIVAHLALLIAAGWIYFAGGYERFGALFGQDWSTGDRVRRAVLFAFGVVTFVRFTFTMAVLLKRRFGWGEFGGVLFATIVYQVGFALLGAGAGARLGWLAGVGIALFVLGSFLNTGSELQRKRFKDDPANAGKLYTRGLFGLARHINFFGDTLWVTGWALLTMNPWSALIPIALTAGFVFGFIPDLARHLRAKYGAQYDEWAKRTKAFVPFVY